MFTVELTEEEIELAIDLLQVTDYMFSMQDEALRRQVVDKLKCAERKEKRQDEV